MSDTVPVEHRGVERISHVGLVQIEAAVVIVGIEIGHTHVQCGAPVLVGDVLAGEESE